MYTPTPEKIAATVASEHLHDVEAGPDGTLILTMETGCFCGANPGFYQVVTLPSERFFDEFIQAIGWAPDKKAAPRIPNVYLEKGQQVDSISGRYHIECFPK